MNAAPPVFRPKLMSFDVFGTLIDVRAGSYAAFQSILDACGATHVDVKEFWEHWERRNIRHYWEPYTGYREICRRSIAGDPASIQRYFDAFAGFPLYPDVERVLGNLAKRFRLAIVSNIDDDLLAMTKLPDLFGLVCTAERARGYKPDGTLFRHLIANAGVGLGEILHSGQSQFTDMVGAKPLGLTVVWVNRRGISLSPDVPKPDWTVGDLDALAACIP